MDKGVVLTLSTGSYAAKKKACVIIWHQPTLNIKNTPSKRDTISTVSPFSSQSIQFAWLVLSLRPMATFKICSVTGNFHFSNWTQPPKFPTLRKTSIIRGLPILYRGLQPITQYQKY